MRTDFTSIDTTALGTMKVTSRVGENWLSFFSMENGILKCF
ncbi:unnamed protein product [Spirodela intermedia]|uniref:Uncharacterized protein n=1 Tax=Spirodela intermedia TaxID=51605 RepID=A0A7I8KNU2_SPIIN|nr:unnamed protein product [Spirodela intermedia]